MAMVRMTALIWIGFRMIYSGVLDGVVKKDGDFSNLNLLEKGPGVLRDRMGAVDTLAPVNESKGVPFRIFDFGQRARSPFGFRGFENLNGSFTNI